MDIKGKNNLILAKIFSNKNTKILSVFLVVFLFSFVFVNDANALLDGIAKLLFNVISAFFESLAYIAVMISKVFVIIFSSVIQGTGAFANSSAVDVVWTFVRDLVNMSFIIAMLIAAIYKMIGKESSLKAKKFSTQIIYILIGAFIINFSKAILGAFIDITNLISMIFVNSYKDSINNVFNNFFYFSTVTGAARNMLESILLFVFGLGLFAYCATLLLYGVIRMGILTISTMLSPLLIFSFFFPKKIDFIDKLNIKKQFFSFSFGGITVTFFLWVCLMILSAGGTSQLDNAIFGTSDAETIKGITNEDVAGGSTTSSDFWDGALLKIVAVAILLLGQKTAMDMAKEAGFGAEKFVGKIADGVNTFGMTPLNFTKGLAKSSVEFGSKKLWDKAIGDRTLFGTGAETINQRIADFNKGGKQLKDIGWDGYLKKTWNKDFTTPQIDEKMETTNRRIKELQRIRKDNGGILSDNDKKELEYLNMQRTSLQLQRKGKRFGEDKLSADYIKELPKDTLLALAPTLDEKHFKDAWVKIKEKDPELAMAFNKAHQNATGAIDNRVDGIKSEKATFKSDIQRISGIVNNSDKAKQYNEFFEKNNLSDAFEAQQGGTVLDKRTGKLIDSQDIINNPDKLSDIFQSAKLSSDIGGYVTFDKARGVYIDNETGVDISEYDAAKYITSKLKSEKRAVKKQNITSKENVTAENLSKLPVNTVIQFLKDNPKLLRDKDKLKDIFTELDKADRYDDIDELKNYLTGEGEYIDNGYIQSIGRPLNDSSTNYTSLIQEAAKDGAYGFAMGADGKIRDAKNKSITYDLSDPKQLEAATKTYKKGIKGNMRDIKRVSNIMAGSFNGIISSNVGGVLSRDEDSLREVSDLIKELDDKQQSILDPDKIEGLKGLSSPGDQLTVIKRIVDMMSKSGKLNSDNIKSFVKYLGGKNFAKLNKPDEITLNGVLSTLFNDRNSSKIDESSWKEMLYRTEEVTGPNGVKTKTQEENELIQIALAKSLHGEKYKSEYGVILEQLKNGRAIKEYTDNSGNFATLSNNFQEVASNVENPELITTFIKSIAEKFNNTPAKDQGKIKKQFENALTSYVDNSTDDFGDLLTNFEGIANGINNQSVRNSFVGALKNKFNGLNSVDQNKYKQKFEDIERRYSSSNSSGNTNQNTANAGSTNSGTNSSNTSGNANSNTNQNSSSNASSVNNGGSSSNSSGNTNQNTANAGSANNSYNSSGASSFNYNDFSDAAKNFYEEAIRYFSNIEKTMDRTTRDSSYIALNEIKEKISNLTESISSGIVFKDAVDSVNAIDTSLKYLKDVIGAVDANNLSNFKSLENKIEDLKFGFEISKDKNNVGNKVEFTNKIIAQIRRLLEGILPRGGSNEINNKSVKEILGALPGLVNADKDFLNRFYGIVSSINNSNTVENEASRVIVLETVKNTSNTAILGELLSKVNSNQKDIIKIIQDRINSLNNFGNPI